MDSLGEDSRAKCNLKVKQSITICLQFVFKLVLKLMLVAFLLAVFIVAYKYNNNNNVMIQ